MTTKAPATRVVIKIAEINQKLKKDGKTPFWNIVTDDKDFYSVFKADIVARLRLAEDNAVMVEESTVGDKTYRNIVGIGVPEEPEGVDISELVPGGPAPASAPAKPKTTTTVVNNMADIRGQALASAALLAAHGVIPARDIEKQSEEFAKYILVGKAEHKNSSGGISDDEQYVENE